jgi:L-seryl-tRNA(Ser) seleniumtransferase
MPDSAETAARRLPSISSLLGLPEIVALGANVPRPALLTAVRSAVAAVRSGSAVPPVEGEWAERVRTELNAATRSTLARVINATGIVLHTNLGRAVLAEEAIDAMQRVARGYSTLEYDVESGERGSRHSHCVPLLRELTGAEDALVVNNCAAAMVLALNTLASDRDVVISRGELIEIGGSFRIPEIMSRSAARLVEVGTTNRTHAFDYRASVTDATAAVVKVHRSNFALSGYTAEVPLRELAALADELHLPLVYDLGSGLMFGLEAYGLPPEPTATQAVADGAALVLMSGDKLVGGPQAGIAVGRREIVASMRANPLARALRVDKLTIAALEATLRLLTDPARAVDRIPTLAMICAPEETIRIRAEAVAGVLRGRGHAAEVVPSVAAVGAGAFPAHEIPSAAIAFEDASLAGRLRAAPVPVIGRIRDDRVLLDLRSVRPQDDEALVESLLLVLGA